MEDAQETTADGTAEQEEITSDATEETESNADVKSDGFDKVRQQVQQELGNFSRKNLDPLSQQIFEIKTSLDGIRQASQASSEAQETDELDSVLKGLDEDDVVDGKMLAATIKALGSKLDKASSKLDPQMEGEISGLRSQISSLSDSQAWNEWHDHPENSKIDGRKIMNDLSTEADSRSLEGDHRSGWISGQFESRVLKARDVRDHGSKSKSGTSKSESRRSTAGLQTKTEGANVAPIPRSDVERFTNGIPMSLGNI